MSERSGARHNARVMGKRRAPRWRREVAAGMGVAALSMSSLTLYGYLVRSLLLSAG